MRMWRRRAWRIVVLAAMIGLAVGIGVTLNAYYHARATAASRAAEARELGAKLDEARRAQELALAESRQTAEVLEQAAEGLEDLQTAQRATALEDRMTSETLQQAAIDLEKLQTAQQMTADQGRETSQALDQTAAELEKLQVAQRSTADEYRRTVEALQDAIAQLGLGESPMEALFPGAEPDASVLQGSAVPVCPDKAAGSDEASQCIPLKPVLAEDAALHARLLIWKHLGRPGYSVFSITRVFSAVANLWHAAGQFSCVGGVVREFAASVRHLPNGKWLLLSFQWIGTERGSGELQNAGPCCCP